MKREEIQDEILEILVMKMDLGIPMDLEEINDDTNLESDMGLDSLDQIELVMECEREFDIAIDDADVENFQTMGDVLDYSEARLKG